MTTQVVFDTYTNLSQGLPGTAPQVFTATTDQTLAVITTSGAFATYLATGIFKLKDVIFVNYDVDGTEGQAILTVTSTSSGSLVDYSIPAGYLSVAGTPVYTNGPTGYPVVVKNVVVGQAALASGGAVEILPSTGAHQYQILDIILNSGGTNFSGGSGNRLGQVTDGTTVYSVIPAATMQTLTNSLWGSTAVAAPASAPYDTATAAGTALSFKYSGGTTDYTAGSLTITVIAALIA